MHEMIRVAAGVVEKLSTSGGRKTFSAGLLNNRPGASLHPFVKMRSLAVFCVDLCSGRGLAP